MKLNHLTIGQRLGLLATLLLLATLFIGVRALSVNASGLAQNNRIMATQQIIADSIDTARNAQVQFKIQVQEWKNTLLRGNQDQKTFDKYRTAFIDQSQKTRQLLTHLGTLLPQIGMDNKQVLETSLRHAELEKHYLDALQQYAIDDPTSAQRVDKLVTGIDREPTKMIDEVVSRTLAHAGEINQQTHSQNQAQYQQTRLMLFITMGLTLLVGALVTWWLVTSITRPLSQAVMVARSVAEGNLQQDITVAGRDETAGLMRALQEMNDNLTRIVADVRNGTETIASASAQIAIGSRDLSARNEAQASALEQTAASMEQLTSVVKSNAGNSHNVRDIARDARAIADKGGEAVERAVQTMSEVSAFSSEINSIISMIDSIAFQTNILALNAAVEAARAGSEGRGFAVVAAEVRALAQRSAGAAKEIRLLIDRSVNRIDDGNAQVKEAGSAMAEILQSVSKVSELIEAISQASHEQSAGIDQVNLAVTHMDTATQQNATLSQESSAAAHAMHREAEQLLATVSVFKLRDNALQKA